VSDSIFEKNDRIRPQPMDITRLRRTPASVHEQEVARLEQLAHWLDSVFRIPGTNVRFGFDAILGLIPGLGDGVTALPSIYVVMAAHRMGVPKLTLARMGMNVGIDVILGAIPLLGDLFDIGFKANRKNVALLKRHIEKRSEQDAAYHSA
jgi:hypothetical protein